MSYYIPIIIAIIACITMGCKSNSESKDEVVYTYESDIEDECDAGRSLDSNLCQGKHEIRRHRIDTSEEAINALSLASSIREQTSDFITGYKNGWKEQANNNLYYMCQHHQEVRHLYTPMMIQKTNESDDYRQGWQLGWNRAAVDAKTLLDELTENIQNK